MKTIAPFFLFSALLMTGSLSTSAALTTADISVEEILQNNLLATRLNSGGTAVTNTDKVLHIAESDYSLIARYRATSDGHMRIDVFSDGNRVFSEGKDDQGAWEWPADKEAPENIYHEGSAALEHGIEFNLFSLSELAKRGHHLQLLDSEIIQDTQYFVLKVTLSDGFETYRYINTQSWLVELSRDFRAFHPGIDDTKQHLETRYDQWRQDDGVVYASRSQNIDLETKEIIATTLVLESKYNVTHEQLDLHRGFVPDGTPDVVQ